MSISEDQKKEYQKYVKEITPTHSLPLEMGKAFLTGGIICLLGQLLQNAGMALGLEQEAAGTWCSILLVLVSVLLTGFGIYPLIAKWGGAGALVPITGFANGVASSAIEYKRKGRSSASVPKSSPLPVLSSCTVCLLPGFWDSSTGSSTSCNPDRVLL